MKTKKAFIGMIAISSMMASCLSDDVSYRAGFVVESPTSNISSYYANNVSDSLIFFSYGNWEIVDLFGYDNTWLTVPTRKGKGSALYSQQITFMQNDTEKSRTAVIQLKDTSHPEEARSALAFIQHATRGDGSLGSAADVKSITGSDGSNFTLEYDMLHRPTEVIIRNSEQILSQLKISYDDYSKQMTVKDNGKEFTVEVGNDYQPNMLINSGDTIGYFSRYYSNYVPVSANYIFNYEHRGLAGYSCVTYQFPYNKYSLSPDSIHNADTLSYYKDGKLMRQLGISYSQQDNRHQSVDVNQLILGVKECDPYLLVSLFRYARNSSIIAEAKNDDETVSVIATLNADKSVNQMTVKRGGETVTYSFNY